MVACRVAGAVHRASWTSCGARGRLWGRGCLLCGRCSTQSRLDKLLLRVAAAGAAAAFRVAGAVHRASWRGCIARVRRCFRAAVATHHSPFITHHVAHLIHHLHSSRLTYHSHSSVTTSHISLIIHHSSLHHISLPLITVS